MFLFIDGAGDEGKVGGEQLKAGSGPYLRLLWLDRLGTSGDRAKIGLQGLSALMELCRRLLRVCAGDVLFLCRRVSDDDQTGNLLAAQS